MLYQLTEATVPAVVGLSPTCNVVTSIARSNEDQIERANARWASHSGECHVTPNGVV